MIAVLDALLALDEPSIHYKVQVALAGLDPTTAEARRLRDTIRRSRRVQQLLSERTAEGTIPRHPYSKWDGAHWVLVTLADLNYPPGDLALAPLREQVLAWLFSEQHQRQLQQRTIAGRVRAHASFEGNAIYALRKLGLADRRVDVLVERLLAWQWPDGGWNCDLNPDARTSSFTETLVPLRGLALFGKQTGNAEVAQAVRRAAEVFLARCLFRRQTTGAPISERFLRLHYPCYWHYDVLFGLTVLDEAGYLGDPRCREALDLLQSKRLPDGGFPAEERYHRPTPSPAKGSPRLPISGRSPVDWGGTSRRRLNPFVTIEALVVLKHAGRLGG